MTFNTRLTTLHQRLLEATAEEHGAHDNSYTTVDLLEDLDEEVSNPEDIRELVEDLLELTTDDLYCNMGGDNFQGFINRIEEAQYRTLPPPAPPRHLIDVDDHPPSMRMLL